MSFKTRLKKAKNDAELLEKLEMKCFKLNKALTCSCTCQFG